MIRLPAHISVFETIWAFTFGLAIILVWAIWVLFVFKVNPRLDPDWKDRRWSAFEQSWRPFFGFTRALNYAGAISSRWIARRLFFHDRAYDFRKKVGPTFVVLAVVHHTLLAYLFLCVIVGYLLGFDGKV